MVTKIFSSLLLKTSALSSYFNSDVLKFENEHKRLSKALGVITYDKLEDIADELLY